MVEKNSGAGSVKGRRTKSEAMAFREKILKKLKDEEICRKAALLISEMLKNMR